MLRKMNTKKEIETDSHIVIDNASSDVDSKEKADRMETQKK